MSDEDEAAEMDPEELAKIQPKPEEGAAEASAEQVGSYFLYSTYCICCAPV